MSPAEGVGADRGYLPKTPWPPRDKLVEKALAFAGEILSFPPLQTSVGT